MEAETRLDRRRSPGVPYMPQSIVRLVWPTPRAISSVMPLVESGSLSSSGSVRAYCGLKE